MCLVTQSCLTLCGPMDCSPPGSSVHGILQARILEWVAIPFSREPSRPRDGSRLSRIAGRFFTWVEPREPWVEGNRIQVTEGLLCISDIQPWFLLRGWGGKGKICFQDKSLASSLLVYCVTWFLKAMKWKLFLPFCFYSFDKDSAFCVAGSLPGPWAILGWWQRLQKSRRKKHMNDFQQNLPSLKQ